MTRKSLDTRPAALRATIGLAFGRSLSLSVCMPFVHMMSR